MSNAGKHVYTFLKEGFNIPQVHEKIKKELTMDEYLTLDLMVNGEIKNTHILNLYLKGYLITEIAEARGITKQRVSIILAEERKDHGISVQDAKRQNREVREKLKKLSEWYAGVYRADVEGSLEPTIDAVDNPNMATLSVIYQKYKSLGGEKIELLDADIDRRRWHPEEDKVGARAVQMYFEGKSGREIRDELNISSEELFMHYRRYLRMREEQNLKGKGNKEEAKVDN